LLEQVGIPHEVIVSGADETIDGPPDEQTRILAMRKAEAVYDTLVKQRVFTNRGGWACPSPTCETNPTPIDITVIIAADTLVYIDGKVLGKPDSPDEAFNMLKALQGRCHTVYTGVAVLQVGTDENVTESFVESAQVYFRKLTDSEIWSYISTGEPFDKAGAYGVQEKGALLVERIEGDFFTVVGLPLSKLAVTLAKIGVEVW